MKFEFWIMRFTSNLITKNIYFFLFIILLTSCHGKKYTTNDGDVIFSSSTSVAQDQRLISLPIEPLPVIKNTCMNVTDFDYQNAGISMESYPEINIKQYKKYFSRSGKFDFYLHPIICDGIVYDIRQDATIVVYKLKDKNVKKIHRYDVLNKTEKKNILISQARLENNVIYISTGNGIVLAFDVNQKKLVWKKQFKTIFSASPTIYKDNLYLVSGDDEVYAINKLTGDLVWKTNDDINNAKKSFQISPITIFKDKIVACFSNGWINVLDASGKLVWKNKIMTFNGVDEDINDIDFPPILFNDILVAGGIKTSVMGFDFKTGTPLWQIPTGLNSYIFVNSQGAGFFVNDKNENICFIVYNGLVRWVKPHERFIKTNVSKYLNNGSSVYNQTINRYFDAY